MQDTHVRAECCKSHSNSFPLSFSLGNNCSQVEFFKLQFYYRTHTHTHTDPEAHMQQKVSFDSSKFL